ncbi:MAG: RNA polymerase sigma factor [Gemmatimonadaceae bacterium]
MTAAVQRIGDREVISKVGHRLAAGTAQDLFALLCDDDSRVIAAAHECAMLRYGNLAAITAEALRFDEHARDDLVQRTFLDLPRAVRRTTNDGIPISNPEGWLRRRAYLIAHQMLREEHGTPLRASATGALQRDERGRMMRTRGIRVPVEMIDASASDLDRSDSPELERAELVYAVLVQLAEERPLWAQVIRLHYLEGLPLHEIAGRLGRTHGTIRNDIHRARVRLRALIDDREARDAGASPREPRHDDG